MPTLMGKETFGELSSIWKELDAGPAVRREQGKLAGIFVPWAGSRLRREGGIYYVGIATNGAYRSRHPTNFETQLRLAESLCAGTRHKWARTPFWRFLDGLTWALLAAPFDKSSDRWGWSNLVKIGWSVGNPRQWLVERQREACVDTIREEFENLRKSLILIVSSNSFGILENPNLFPKIIPRWKNSYEDNWNKEYHEQTGIWSFVDSKSGNLYVHAYHPGYAVRAPSGLWRSALGRIIHLARGMPGFASASVGSSSP